MNDKPSINDLVDKWHESPEITEDLHKFLGMKWREYAKWVETGKLPERMKEFYRED